MVKPFLGKGCFMFFTYTSLAMLLYLANTTLDFSGFLRISIPARLGSGVESLIDEVVEKYGTMPLEKLPEEVYSISEVRSVTPGSIIL